MYRRSVFLALAFVISYSALRTPHSALSQEGEKAATLRWFGQSFFQLETANKKLVVFDPQAIAQFGRPILDADIVLISHEHADHNQVDWLKDPKTPRVFRGLKVEGKKLDWAKIDEKVGTIRVRTVGTFHDAVGGTKYGKNAVFVVEADGLVFCHLGDLGHELSDEQVKAIGPVDVLMVPVGGVYTLNGETAKKVVAQLKPKLYVVPMHYGLKNFDELLGPEEFLDEQKNVKKLPDTNELVIPLGMKAPDAPTVVVLGYEKAQPKK